MTHKVKKAKIQEIRSPAFQSQGVRVYIKREDQIHPEVSGNKWYKLKYNLKEARTQGYSTLLTFGGAYSNHIFATAAAAKLNGLKSIGIIRGEEHLPLNPTLQSASNHGMKIHYVSRNEYREKNSIEFIKKLHRQYGDFYLIPEGGTNALAIKGAKEIVTGHEDDFDFWCLPVGTGGTLTGIAQGLSGRGKVLGFSVLKGEFIHHQVAQLFKDFTDGQNDHWTIIDKYHFGGYAKFSSKLLDFLQKFETDHGIPLEPLYTGKMIYGLTDLIAQGYFPEGSKILAIHTGGLQGLSGLKERGII